MVKKSIRKFFSFAKNILQVFLIGFCLPIGAQPIDVNVLTSSEALKVYMTKLPVLHIEKTNISSSLFFSNEIKQIIESDESIEILKALFLISQQKTTIEKLAFQKVFALEKTFQNVKDDIIVRNADFFRKSYTVTIASNGQKVAEQASQATNQAYYLFHAAAQMVNILKHKELEKLDALAQECVQGQFKSMDYVKGEITALQKEFSAELAKINPKLT